MAVIDTMWGGVLFEIVTLIALWLYSQRIWTSDKSCNKVYRSSCPQTMNTSLGWLLSLFTFYYFKHVLQISHILACNSNDNFICWFEFCNGYCTVSPIKILVILLVFVSLSLERMWDGIIFLCSLRHSLRSTPYHNTDAHQREHLQCLHWHLHLLFTC